eukprot:CAMPEP_0115467488 /NCGR_PEP_ID=MMETSP0271-20121206/50465_1 /TAXON_ID=71861 /ORGANISM="Scrippsiella trochoidea, Strain CCMP3099" /LENGTH=217 /DNA_ID=CAMNT_0002894507 /DNA_START=409 /DNA_END=1064 /DNA_ORIENTATION=+
MGSTTCSQKSSMPAYEPSKAITTSSYVMPLGDSCFARPVETSGPSVCTLESMLDQVSHPLRPTALPELKWSKSAFAATSVRGGVVPLQIILNLLEGLDDPLEAKGVFVGQQCLQCTEDYRAIETIAISSHRSPMAIVLCQVSDFAELPCVEAAFILQRVDALALTEVWQVRPAGYIGQWPHLLETVWEAANRLLKGAVVAPIILAIWPGSAANSLPG